MRSYNSGVYIGQKFGKFGMQGGHGVVAAYFEALVPHDDAAGRAKIGLHVLEQRGNGIIPSPSQKFLMDHRPAGDLDNVQRVLEW